MLDKLPAIPYVREGFVEPACLMNCCRENAKTTVPPGNRAQRRRLRRVQGVGSEAYLNGTSQGPTPEDTRKDGRILGCSR